VTGRSPGTRPERLLQTARKDLRLKSKSTGAKALALLAGSVLALSACATSSGSSGATSSSAPASATTSNKTFTWAYEQEFSSYNYNTSQGVASANAVVLNPVLGGFWQFNPDGTLLANPDFGTQQKVSDSPLTVKYTINPKATWSDGKPIDCDDFVLAWMANSSLTGAKGFSAASTAGYKDENAPQCKAGDRTVTVVYKTPFSDWQALYGPATILPAHIVEQQAGMTKTFIDYAATPTSPDLAKAIDFYNKGWDFNPGALKKDIIPSSGPYMIDSWAAGQSLTLKANPKYWGTPPKIGTIVLRYIGGPSQAQALQNGEVQAMDPQPQVDIVNQLKAQGSAINFSSGDQFSFEHLDFNFKGEFADPAMRQAFAKCVPRQQIVDNLIKPENQNAKILQSRFVYPFQPAYSGFATGVGGDKYDTVDIAGAKALLAGRTPTVRLAWRKDPAQLNQRRADTLSLIQASCNQAGFKIVDAGTPTFFSKEWPADNFDVAMFAWAGSPLVSSNVGIYNTGGGENPTGYTNPQVDTLRTQLTAETDKDKQTAILKQLDTQLWNDLATIPLYAFPAILATTKNAKGVVYNATQADLSWNAADWSTS
jgi:peptide/nickel transport system substrate-binding protein